MGSPATTSTMDCSVVREALSAIIDGEEGPISDHDADAHVLGCAACRGWKDELATLHRMVRVRAAESVPDLSVAIVDAHRPPTPRRPVRRVSTTPARGPLAEPVSATRWALFVVALTQLVLAGPALLLGEDAGATVHVARELGSFDVALAIGLLVAAWQPLRAWGLFPVAAALGLVMVGTASADLVDGSATAGGEAHHLLDLAGVLLLWLVARGGRPGDVRRTVTTRAA